MLLMRALAMLVSLAAYGATAGPAAGAPAAPTTANATGTSSASTPASANALIAGVFSPPRAAPGFTLAGSDGAPLGIGSYRGKVVLLSFGYTSCTEVCPVTLSILAQARRLLGASASDVQVIYVTVDPERDTAGRMRGFLKAFDPSFLGGTGTAAQLAAVRRDYGISVGGKIPMGSGYALAHSSFTYLVDRQGMLRALMPFGHGAADFAHDVRLLLAP
jgi:protein SCO1/2